MREWERGRERTRGREGEWVNERDSIKYYVFVSGAVTEKNYEVYKIERSEPKNFHTTLSKSYTTPTGGIRFWEGGINN